MTLKEPPLLSDVAAATLPGGGPLVGQAASLLARPFEPGEAVIVKCGSVANALGVHIAGLRPDTRLLALHTPLDLYLASLAGKGLWGRLWGRRLFLGLANAGLVDLGIEGRELLEQTDLQLAACAWLSIHRLLGEALARFGPDRARSVDSRLRAHRSCADARDDRDIPGNCAGRRCRRRSRPPDPRRQDRRCVRSPAAAGRGRRLAGPAPGRKSAWSWDRAEKVADVARIGWTLPHPLSP